MTRTTRDSARVTVADLGDLPPVLTIEEASELLRLGRSAAYAAAARGDIPTLKVGRRRLVPTARLLELLGAGHEIDLPATNGEAGVVQPAQGSS